jgi:hypothetical protein
MMLSEKAVALLAVLPYRPDAKWAVNILPFGSIYWEDEMPLLADLLDKQQDMSIIHGMFGVRLKLWDGQALDTQDQQLWDAVKRQVPQWALFHRLNLNDEQKHARQEAEEQVAREFDSWSDDPDSISGQSRSGETKGTIVHRVFSAILGLVLAVAGLAASDYIPTNFKGDTLLSGAMAILVPGVLMLSAFYMAFRFLKFAVTGKK